MPRQAEVTLEVDIGRQELLVRENGRVVERFPVSTAANGPGERDGSGCTPRGRHVIRACIGRDASAGAVFVGRRPTGEIYSAALAAAQPQRDWILSRILWLSGLEPGFNRLGDVDTMRRYIYIHGTSDEEAIGRPVSAGCIRMRNRDVLALFERVRPGTEVTIHE